MVMRADVVVIGGGMAGAMASITSARSGLDTILVRRGYGATSLSSGALDLTGTAAWLRWAMGTDGAQGVIDAAVAEFQSLMAEVDYPFAGDTRRDMLLINALGTVKHTQLCPATLRAGDLKALAEARILFVGVNGYGDFSASHLSKSLQFLSRRGLVDARVETAGVSVDFPRVRRAASLDGFDLAQLLDDQEVAAELAGRIREQADLGRHTHLAFPAVLGWNRPETALSTLEGGTGLPCFEVLSPPPSVPGYRLQHALDRAMQRHGVRIVHAGARGFEAGAGRVRRVLARQKETDYVLEPEIVILASGKFIAGGIERSDRLREPVFDLPVCADGQFEPGLGIEAFVNERFLGEQPIFSAGVKVDARLRPVTPDGQAVYSNLMAAGAVITGYDYTQGNGGMGIPLVSGILCARLAAEQLGRGGAVS